MYAAEHAHEHPDQPAIVMAGSGQVVTFGEYEAAANRLAHLFRAAGLRRGDHVAFFVDNPPRLPECMGAAERTGLYYTCVSHHLTAPEAAYVVDNCEARVVVTSAALRPVAEQLPALCPRVERWLILGGAPSPGRPFERYEDAVGPYPAGPVPDEQLGAAMLYSSGTTGRPKGILRPLPEGHPEQPLPVMAFVSGMFGFRAGMTYLSPAPLYHSAPQASIAAALRLGATVIVMEKFDAAQWLDLVARHRVTHSQVVPTMLIRLLQLPAEVRAAADLSSLEVVVHAAAPCPVPVKRQIIEWFGPIVVEYYGATEAMGFTFCDSAQWLAHPGTVGRPVLGELLILDEHGQECPPGTPGTVWFRGATNFEYFRDPEKTAESQDETGTASTVGDVGYVDEDGYLYLTDRKSYMIISGGVNVYPQETENLLATHPKVFDAAVLGIPDPDLGEVVHAVVQLRPGVPPGPEVERELVAYCRANLAHIKCPRAVDFEAELPRLPTGKLYKRLLRDRYWPSS
jgi:long-chain acyl-CoA synthetase